MRPSLLFWLPALALTTLVPESAVASLTFPDAVKAAIPSIECVPRCTLCHQSNPGLPPANKQFALNMKMTSAVLPQQVEQLRTALAKMQMNEAAGLGTDADADGTKDFAELLMGGDPNVAGGDLCETVPLYGCGATIAPRTDERAKHPSAAVSAVLTVLAGLWFMRRRGR